MASDKIAKLKRNSPAPKGFLGYIKKAGSGVELIVPLKSITTLIPDWERIKKSQEVRRLLKTDGSHQTVKRRLRGEAERVYCFSIPAPGLIASE